jgi:small subunit ribosomal protein S2
LCGVKEVRVSLPEELKKLLESGVHFGHQAKRWNPKMKRYIFGKRSGIYIIDLEKTLSSIKDVQNVVSGIAAKGGKILFVGTKKQAQGILKESAESCDMPYVTERWVGGLLTNFTNIHGRVLRYKEMAAQHEAGVFEHYTKKEIVLFAKQLEKMRHKYDGIKNLDELPRAIFVIDPKKEILAVREAANMNIPIIALIDTDGDPDVVDYPIPGNDDALKSIRTVLSFVVDAIRNTSPETVTVSDPAITSAQTEQSVVLEGGEAKGETTEADEIKA